MYVSPVLSRNSVQSQLTRSDRLLQILDRLLLAVETGALLVVKPSKLLQDLGVGGIAFEDTRVGGFGRVVLSPGQQEHVAR